MKLINFALSATIALTATLSFLPSMGGLGRKAPSGYWENADTYVYYTLEDAVFQGVEDGVGYFWVQDSGTYGAYIYDTDLVEGDEVTLTFENRETRKEYLLAEEYGIKSDTRIDNARIIEIN